MKRGIFLVANLKSQDMCENLVYSIRKSGCGLPIRIIHFGGEEINSHYLLAEAELLHFEDFPEKAKDFIANLRSVLTDCPLGFLYRYLGWYSDWDEFIYSDNDVVALSNWEKMFDYLQENVLVHADEEYTTKGVFNYDRPELVEDLFGKGALKTAITAGHIVVKRNAEMIEDINKAVNWFKQHPHIPKKHDQSLLHIAALIGNWKMVNLCKPPYNWLSSWSGDYKNSLELMQVLQAKEAKISHLHYSGGMPHGNRAIQDLLFSNKSDDDRIKKLIVIGSAYLTGVYAYRHQVKRIKRFIRRKISQ